jgi:hypothetical protein
MKAIFGVCCAKGVANPKTGFVASLPKADLQQNQFLLGLTQLNQT